VPWAVEQDVVDRVQWWRLLLVAGREGAGGRGGRILEPMPMLLGQRAGLLGLLGCIVGTVLREWGSSNSSAGEM
jgi:hypothetical protein